jgi:hypothetical protein
VPALPADPVDVEAGLASEPSCDLPPVSIFDPPSLSVFDPPSLSVFDPPADPDAATDPESLVADESAASAFFVAELRASRLAQPLPLKWIDGVDTAFFSRPPQNSQVVGPGVLMPWMTSLRRPHCAQSYS